MADIATPEQAAIESKRARVKEANRRYWESLKADPVKLNRRHALMKGYSKKCSEKRKQDSNRIEEFRKYQRDYKRTVFLVRPETKVKVKARKSEYSKRPETKARLKAQLADGVEGMKKRIKMLLRARVYKCVTRPVKKETTMDLVGCSPGTFLMHLELQFAPGMTWANYGHIWEIDHIVPCAVFDLTQESERRRCFHFSNMRPLLKPINRSKRDRIMPCQPELLLKLN